MKTKSVYTPSLLCTPSLVAPLWKPPTATRSLCPAIASRERSPGKRSNQVSHPDTLTQDRVALAGAVCPDHGPQPVTCWSRYVWFHCIRLMLLRKCLILLRVRTWEGNKRGTRGEGGREGIVGGEKWLMDVS